MPPTTLIDMGRSVVAEAANSAADCSPVWLLVTTLVLAAPTVIWLTAYLIPQVYMALFRRVPDLKKRYQAEWALVTGGGSGIGRALCFKLASQGLNVVVVSLDDDFLKTTMAALKQQFPKQSFRSVGVTFAPGVDYMAKIEAACKDITVPIVFSNAGYMVTGFCDQTPRAKLLANMECNATAAVNIAHYFGSRLIEKQQQGCIVFTSSVVAFIPAPFSVLYAATKSFVTQLASCLHIEWQPLGVDVCAIHPSPVASQFYSKLDHKIDLIDQAQASAVTPAAVVDDMFKSIGACAVRDMGGLAWGTRLGTWFLPYNLFVRIFAMAAPHMADWKKYRKVATKQS